MDIIKIGKIDENNNADTKPKIKKIQKDCKLYFSISRQLHYNLDKIHNVSL